MLAGCWSGKGERERGGGSDGDGGPGSTLLYPKRSDETGKKSDPFFNGDEGVAAPMYFGDATPPSRSVHQPPV